MKLNSYIDANKDKSFYVYIYFLIYTSSLIMQNVKNDIDCMVKANYAWAA